MHVPTPHPLPIPRPGQEPPIPGWAWTVSPAPLRTASTQTVVVVHGLGDHGRALPYRFLAAALVGSGFDVVAYDQRGHGAVPAAARGAARLPELLADLTTVAQHLQATRGRPPLAVIGLSMGALVVLLTTHRHPHLWRGVVAAAAPIGPVAASPFTVAVAKVLARILPGLPIPSGLDLSQVAADREALATYTGDPHFHTTVRAGLAADLLAAPQILRALAQTARNQTALTQSAGAKSSGTQGARGQRTAISETIPTLLLHGENDTLARWDPTYAALLPPATCTVRLYDQGRHNLFLDTVREAVFADIASWLVELGEE